VRSLAAILANLLFLASALSAPAVELFRYRCHAGDGREFEYVFKTDEQNAPRTVSEEKAAEIAADWMTSFYHVQVGALETQEFRTGPIAHWLFCFSDTIKGPIERIFFVVLLANGMVVQPKVAERL
jgi:ribonucleotide reductase alpha subunit